MNNNVQLIAAGERLEIKLSGRITASNAEETEAAIAALRKANPNGPIALDAEGLEYISSSGLRILMKILKKQGELEMINVSGEVYEILDMTGFVELMTVRKALRTISVEGCDVLGEGGHGKVFRLDGDTIVKVFRSTTTPEEIRREQEYSKKAFVMGIPTAIPFDMVKCGEQLGLVFELMNSDTLSNRIKNEPERVQEYGVKYARLLRELHATKVPEGALDSCRDLYAQRIEVLAKWLSEEEMEKLRLIHNSIPEGDCVIHGDFHPGNIMIQDDELLLIDMADITRGDPLYDLGGMFLTHAMVMDERKEAITGLKAELLGQLWQTFLAAYLDTRDPAVIEMALRKASVLAMVKSATALAFSPEAQTSDFIMNHLLGVIRERLLPNAEQLAMLLSH